MFRVGDRLKVNKNPLLNSNMDVFFNGIFYVLGISDGKYLVGKGHAHGSVWVPVEYISK